MAVTFLIQSSAIALFMLANVVAAAVTPEPRLSIAPNNLGYRPAGTNLVLTCRGHVSSDEVPDFDLKWFKPNGEQIPPDSPLLEKEDNKLKLKFRNPSPDVNGVYKCTGSHNFQSKLEPQSIDVKFFENIDFVDCPVSQVLALGEENASLRCKITSKPIAQVKWSKGGVRITNNDGDQHYILENEGLKIQGPVVMEDAGRYHIEAEVEVTGSLKHRNITVEVHQKPEITSIRMLNGNVPVHGTATELECEAKGIPKPKIWWTKRVSDPNVKQGNLSGLGNYEVNPETGSLKIIRTHFVDDSGIFECIATNGAGAVTDSLELKVYKQPSINSLKNETGISNGSVSLECRVSGFPVPAVSFRDADMNPLADAKFIFDTKQESSEGVGDETVLTMRISPLNRYDGGIYFCLAENDAGNVTQAGHVAVEFKPNVTRTQQVYRTFGSRAVNLTCVVEAVPNATVFWTKGNRVGFESRERISGLRSDRIIENSDEFHIYDDTAKNGLHKLEVRPRNGQENIYRNYICNAHNQHGEASVAIKLDRARVPTGASQIQLRKAMADALELIIRYETSSQELDIDNVTVKYYRETDGAEKAVTKVFKWVANSDVYWIPNLEPDARYRFSTFATNAVGEGAKSMDRTFRTSRPGKPGAPTMFHGTDHSVVESEYGNAFDVKWQKPRSDNASRITEYQIRYYPVYKSSDEWRQEGGPATEVSKVVRNDEEQAELHYMIRDLKPETTYRVEVRAINYHGMSEPVSIVFKTNSDSTSWNIVDVHEGEHMTYHTSEFGTKLAIVLGLLVVLLILMDLVVCCFCDMGVTHIIVHHLRTRYGRDDGDRRGSDSKPIQSLSSEKSAGSCGDPATRSQENLVNGRNTSV